MTIACGWRLLLLLLFLVVASLLRIPFASSSSSSSSSSSRSLSLSISPGSTTAPTKPGAWLDEKPDVNFPYESREWNDSGSRNDDDNDDDDDDDHNDNDNDVKNQMRFEDDNDVEENEALAPLLRVFPCGCVLLTDAVPESIIAHAIRTYVDTGASVTAMSEEAAVKCGLNHLLDKRYHGEATGVGNCRVVGRIPANTIVLRVRATVERQTATHDKGSRRRWIDLPCPEVAVLEGLGSSSKNNNDSGKKKFGSVELLLGLDTLRAWKARICLGTEMEHMTVELNTPRHHSSSSIQSRRWLGITNQDATVAQENTPRPLTANIAFVHRTDKRASESEISTPHLVFARRSNQRQTMSTTSEEGRTERDSHRKMKEGEDGDKEEPRGEDQEDDGDLDLSGF